MSEQGSALWQMERVGKVTASRISDVMATGKGGAPSVTRQNYMAELISERLAGFPYETYSNAAMAWGTETEPDARAHYEFVNDVTVEEVGLINHPLIENAAASPDGLVGLDGLVEIKCPNTATHIKFLQTQELDRRYVFQMQWQMSCAERAWCDFVSFDPRLPTNLSYRSKRVMRDSEVISLLEDNVREFLSETDQTVINLTSLDADNVVA